MRTLGESKIRWEETLKHSSSFQDLQRAVKFNGPNSPCLAGCRSVCWKAFLLFQDTNASNWSHILLESRNTYSTLRDHYLKYIKHPEQLAELSLDPLADDPDSPWNAVRQDEVIRAEILQDVQRLPDEPFYHKESTQILILDILFIYCKLNPDVGGYRQGMHELLAPILYVIDQDAIERDKVTPDDLADQIMVEMLDSFFVEHDAFALFSRVMEKAKPFYEVSNGNGRFASEQSAIVEKSKKIHEVSLMRIDPELSNHLKNVEILPQIFLIRWIRLLFGREFPFEQLLVLWDTIFAFDPSLELIDLICVAMLIRIRWTLLDADYSVALQLLLKYPAPQAPHGPHTFVDDAVYLKDHYNSLGGASLIMKYTGRTPATSSAASSRPSTPSFSGLSIRQRRPGVRSPLASPDRFIQNQADVKALFQGAAKGVFERGEKLGINQAVRDAMGEIKRNMQGFQEARRSMNVNGAAHPTAAFATVAEMEQRNKQLASVLDETISALKSLAESNFDGDKEKLTQTVEMAVAKTQFVKIYLEDSSLDLPDVDTPAALAVSPANKENVSPGPLAGEDEVMADTDEPKPTAAVSTSPTSAPEPSAGPIIITDDAAAAQDPHPLQTTAVGDDRMQTDSPKPSAAPAGTTKLERPHAPIPTRSTLAQSSFSWMLEPDTSASSASSLSASHASRAQQGPSSAHKKRPSSNASRERNAFLFGEVTAPEVGGVGVGGGPGARPFTSDDIFGLEPIRRPRAVKDKSHESLFSGGEAPDS